eukprot:308365-Amphidinium_carterae.2
MEGQSPRGDLPSPSKGRSKAPSCRLAGDGNVQDVLTRKGAWGIHATDHEEAMDRVMGGGLTRLNSDLLTVGEKVDTRGMDLVVCGLRDNGLGCRGRGGRAGDWCGGEDDRVRQCDDSTCPGCSCWFMCRICVAAVMIGQGRGGAFAGDKVSVVSGGGHWVGVGV